MAPHNATCDTPNCDGTKNVVTPEGYVCDSCATEIASEIRSE